MKKLILILSFVSFLSANTVIAQDTLLVKDNEGNILMLVLDEGTTGAVRTGRFIAGSTTTYGDGIITLSDGTNLNIDANTFFIDNANNRVGIGTTNPDTTFHVVGYIKMVDGNQAAGKVLTSDANGVGSWQAAAGGANGWDDDGTVVLLATTGDSIGIGTTTPGEKLEVSGNIKASGTIQSGNSIIIDGTTDTITATGGTISFDDENLTTTGTTTTNAYNCVFRVN